MCVDWGIYALGSVDCQGPWADPNILLYNKTQKFNLGAMAQWLARVIPDHKVICSSQISLMLLLRLLSCF